MTIAASLSERTVERLRAEAYGDALIAREGGVVLTRLRAQRWPVSIDR